MTEERIELEKRMKSQKQIKPQKKPVFIPGLTLDQMKKRHKEQFPDLSDPSQELIIDSDREQDKRKLDS